MDDVISLVPPLSASPQSAFDIFKGRWAYKIPVEGCETGQRLTFVREPPGIKLLRHMYPDHASFDILELGAHEGEQTYHLDKIGRAVYAIEGRPANFLKCLIVQNELGMSRTHFAVGDFHEYLIHGKKVWDLCFCAGVLYHAPDPFELLRLISKRCHRLILSTVIYDHEAMLAADKRTENDRYPTRWLTAIKPTPVKTVRDGLNISYWERRFSTSQEHLVIGHGASHSEFANLIDQSDLRRIIDHLGGKILHFVRTDDERSPHVHIVVEF